MQDVELLDGESALEDNDGGTDGNRATGPLRRLRWWLVGIAAVLVVVLVGAQWLLQSREDAVVAQLAAVEGVVPPVEGQLEVGRRYAQADSDAVFGQQGGGSLTRFPGQLRCGDHAAAVAAL